MRKLVAIAVMTMFVSGCVSNNAVRAIQPSDYNMSCASLKFELADLGVKFEEAKDDSGFTGKNVGMALLFWPGIFVNESRAGKNQSAIDNRISHLSILYNEKCMAEQ
ncbi:hypothetical protein N9X17_04775 [Porticoccaceae bacterium]|jgi:hypothetical protein|nr:hypothetical protein [Porticoccaceae bacterium]